MDEQVLPSEKSPTPGTPTWLRRRHIRISRDIVLFTAGLLGFVHELLLTGGDRQFLLFMCAAMMGLPAFLRKDEK